MLLDGDSPIITPQFVIAGLDPAIHGEPHVRMDHWVIRERSDAVLQTAMPGGDETWIRADQDA